MSDDNTMRHVYQNFQIKNLDDSDAEGTFEGIASPNDGIPDSDGDIIAPGAFDESLTRRGPGLKNRVGLLWEHNRRHTFGSILELRKVDRGLYVKGKCTLGATAGRDAHAFIKDGAVDQMSVGFIPIDQVYDPNTGINTITKANLFEISLTAFPANSGAVITAVKSIRDWEGLLKREGLSNNDAKVGAAALTKALNLRDAGEASSDDLSELRELRDVVKAAAGQSGSAVKSDDDIVSVLHEVLTKSNA